MTRAELEALAVRVETEEPSADLNRAVLLACGWVDCDDHENNWRTPSGGKYECPLPLVSLDAAASLVPEGWRIGDLEQTGQSGSWRCILWTGIGADKIARGTAPTEPQARTAAALRAMAMEASDD